MQSKSGSAVGALQLEAGERINGHDEQAPLLAERRSSSSRGGDGEGGSDGQVWMPMEYRFMKQWRWVDWTRFLFYRCVGPS